MGGRSMEEIFPSPARAAAWSHAHRIGLALATGIRVGEASVASRSVHLLEPADPDGVTVVTDRDAGQVFYHRRLPGQVLHLDVFHTPGPVPPHSIAAAFDRSLRFYRQDRPATAAVLRGDWFDVQTGVGGGRISGSLTGGQRPSVLAAHRAHVHLAGLVPPGEVMFVFYLVAAVEQTLVDARLPLRKVQWVVPSASSAGGAGLEDYAALTDSWLKEDASIPADPVGQEALLGAAVALAEDLGGVFPACALLERIAQRDQRESTLGAGQRLREAMAHLVQSGWATVDGDGWRLTRSGEMLRRVLRSRLREIEWGLRTATRGATARPAGGLLRKGAAAWGAAPGGRRAQAAMPERRSRSELAVIETVMQSVRRQAPGHVQGISLCERDLRFRSRIHPRRVDLCILLDASASMDGERMRGAKTMARHLLLTSSHRVAVITFQEQGAKIAVPFTRNFARAERGLSGIVPSGLTPLAAGLHTATDYVRECRARRPLILLVTDGIPTVAEAGGSPLEEALAAASHLHEERIALCCIGLEPNERYMTELVARASGRLYVVPELHPEILTRLAAEEQWRSTLQRR